MYEGFKSKKKLIDETIAFHIMWTTSPHVKKPYTLSQILGNKAPNKVKNIHFNSKKEKDDHLKKIFHNLRGKGGTKNSHRDN